MQQIDDLYDFIDENKYWIVGGGLLLLGYAVYFMVTKIK